LSWSRFDSNLELIIAVPSENANSTPIPSGEDILWLV